MVKVADTAALFCMTSTPVLVPCRYLGGHELEIDLVMIIIIMIIMCWRCAGAELANVMNEAALEAVRREGALISSADIYNAMDRILQVRACVHSCCLYTCTAVWLLPSVLQGRSQHSGAVHCSCSG